MATHYRPSTSSYGTVHTYLYRSTTVFSASNCVAHDRWILRRIRGHPRSGHPPAPYSLHLPCMRCSLLPPAPCPYRWTFQTSLITSVHLLPSKVDRAVGYRPSSCCPIWLLFLVLSRRGREDLDQLSASSFVASGSARQQGSFESFMTSLHRELERTLNPWAPDPGSARPSDPAESTTSRCGSGPRGLWRGFWGFFAAWSRRRQCVLLGGRFEL
jgi:hypothetical protein